MDADQEPEQEDSRPAKERGTGCWWGIGFLLITVGGVLVCSLLAPYFQPKRTVKLTVLDKAGSPVPGAEIEVFQSDASWLVPMIEMHRIHRKDSYLTDARGQVQFEIKYGQVSPSVLLERKFLKQVSATTETRYADGRKHTTSGALWWSTSGHVKAVEYVTTITVELPENKKAGKGGRKVSVP